MSDNKKLKIINDPVHGFISIPTELIFELIEHPFFQRLRRISQMGLSSLVYPGAVHNRFHHALGCLGLMQKAVHVLRTKGTEISPEEEEALYIAMMLHDIGHGPLSHALEKVIINDSHEALSTAIMQQLNQEFSGKLSLAIQIFENGYHRKFLHQLIHGQIDIDRLDYLQRDSFFTGVREGSINAERIIQMFVVKEDQLQLEEKGLYSVEKFLVARILMYWQVYLHRTGVSAELMLHDIVSRAIELNIESPSMALNYFIKRDRNAPLNPEVLTEFAHLDDDDVWMMIKSFINTEDDLLRYWSQSLLNRRLFKVKYYENDDEISTKTLEKIENNRSIGAKVGQVSTVFYDMEDPIVIAMKNGAPRRFEEMSLLINVGSDNLIKTKSYTYIPKAVKV